MKFEKSDMTAIFNKASDAVIAVDVAYTKSLMLENQQLSQNEISAIEASSRDFVRNIITGLSLIMGIETQAETPAEVFQSYETKEDLVQDIRLADYLMGQVWAWESRAMQSDNYNDEKVARGKAYVAERQEVVVNTMVDYINNMQP